ncbi:hypothetical protein [Pseudomonas sp. FEN]|uniref:hypothetical protein n=1 Tax=Pseudomonas sp. FEN TaxID=2767468 RepID=UPI001CD2E306|nr:hypothetical protein [Pseudomonas sp. FEN]
MSQGHCQYYLESDEYKAYKEIEEQIGHCTPEQAWAMYCVSAGVVRENIVLAVMEQIARGNKALLVEFPNVHRLKREIGNRAKKGRP